MTENGRLVVGISGASGVVLGIRMLEYLKTKPVQTHLVISPSARKTISLETDWAFEDVVKLADRYYGYTDIGGDIASGSFYTAGMVVIPCSIKTLSAVANSYSQDLLSRAADVTLKEGRPLLLDASKQARVLDSHRDLCGDGLQELLVFGRKGADL